MRFKSNTDKGVAGLTILLSLVTMLFVIGLLVMIFALMGGELQDATYDSTAVDVVNESITWVGTGNVTVTGASTLHFANWNATAIVLINGSTLAGENTTLVEGTDYILYVGNNGIIGNLTTDSSDGARASYSYIYDAGNDATNVMGNTTVGIANVVDWFDIFVVIGAMVVLILLTVIIITAIRGSGLMAGGSA